jgi:penicillin-binding protein 1A
MSRKRKSNNHRGSRARSVADNGGSVAPAKPRIKKLRILLIVLGLMVLAGISTIFGLMMAVASELPRLEDREQYKIAKKSVLVDTEAREIAVLRNNENRILVKPSQVAQSMKQAVVAIEDRRFYEHRGVDYRGIARAVYTDISGLAARQGASTITQQFVKNALVANTNRTVLQKLREAALAYHLEREWSKEKILNEYLNAIYFGNGAYGVEAAAETYFGKEAHPGCAENHSCAKVLDPWETALLAGMIASPSMYDPVADPEAATNRRNLVLKNMLDQGFLSPSTYRQSIAKSVPSSAEIARPKEFSVAPYFSSWIRQQLVERYGPGVTFGGGLKVKTTLDLDLQRAAEQSITGILPAGGPTASLVAIENKTGKIRAMVGGFDFDKKPFNLATQGHRQPGSAFKPFALAAALNKGISLNKTLVSAKLDASKYGYEVSNYEDQYAGVVSLYNATVTSDNTAYVRLALENNLIGRTVKMAHKMGIRTALSENAAMVLGGLRVGVTPMEMAYAYSTFANGGRRASGSMAPRDGEPVAIERVTQGGKLFRKQRDRTRMYRVMSKKAAGDAVTALRGVVSSGTGKRAAIGGFAAGKTGTTENYGDAWFVGFNEEMTVAIWVGYPDNVKPMLTEYGGQPVAGGTYPAVIWARFVGNAMQILRQRELNKGKPVTGSTGASTPAPGPDDSGSPEDDGGDRRGGDDEARRPRDDNGDTPRDRQPADPAPAEPAPDTGGDVSPGGGTAPG